MDYITEIRQKLVLNNEVDVTFEKLDGTIVTRTVTKFIEERDDRIIAETSNGSVSFFKDRVTSVQ